MSVGTLLNASKKPPESLGNAFENWNVTGYYKWGTITSRIVDGMRLYYQASEQGANPEWEKWAKMPWVQPEFQKSKKEFSDSLKG
ncbi:hypothetical protein XPA_006970 [Xanthoria parietina]